MITLATKTSASVLTGLTEHSTGHSTNEDLDGIIKAAVATVASIDPIDLVAHYHKSDVFDEDVEGTTEVRFRLFVSRSQRRLVWACETRNGLANRDSFVGNVLFNGSVIQGDKLTVTNGIGNEVTNKPFDQLMRDVRILHPASGVLGTDRLSKLR